MARPYTRKEITHLWNNNKPIDDDRLFEYMKVGLHKLCNLFLFEYNNTETRTRICTEINKTFSSYPFIMDWVVVCDEHNNTIERIMYGVLYIDVAFMVAYHKDPQWFYLPIRISPTPIQEHYNVETTQDLP